MVYSVLQAKETVETRPGGALWQNVYSEGKRKFRKKPTKRQTKPKEDLAEAHHGGRE